MKNTLSSLLRLLLLGTLLCALLGCQSTRRLLDFDTRAVIDFQSLQGINPDTDGRPSPVVVRVFKLADQRQFSREDFLNLYENPEARLGKDLLGTLLLKELAPGEDRRETIELSPDVRYLGLLAEFVQYQRADAILILPITDHNTNKFDVTLARVSLFDTHKRRESRYQTR